MYGKEEAQRCANRRYQADAGRTGGEAGQGQSPKNEGKAEEQTLSGKAENKKAEIKDGPKGTSRLSEDFTAGQSKAAEDLATRIGLKKNKVEKPQYPTRERASEL